MGQHGAGQLRFAAAPFRPDPHEAEAIHDERVTPRPQPGERGRVEHRAAAPTPLGGEIVAVAVLERDLTFTIGKEHRIRVRFQPGGQFLSGHHTDDVSHPIVQRVGAVALQQPQVAGPVADHGLGRLGVQVERRIEAVLAGPRRSRGPRAAVHRRQVSRQRLAVAGDRPGHTFAHARQLHPLRPEQPAVFLDRQDLDVDALTDHGPLQKAPGITRRKLVWERIRRLQLLQRHAAGGDPEPTRERS